MSSPNLRPFHLEKPRRSIFTGLTCREHPTLNLVYGFVKHQMGIKLRKHVVATYGDEQTHYKAYIKNQKKADDETRYVSVLYSFADHGWGRINACGSLSMSLFHRPTRHAFAKEKYIDCDMVNCQPQLLLELARKHGLCTEGLDEYCANPKKMRYDIAAHYKLKDIVSDDGVVVTAYEQAKKLPLRLAFGGCISKWKTDYNASASFDMPLIIKMEMTINGLCSQVCEDNPHIRADCELDAKWASKSEDEKNRSVMALYAQTWERILQEFCIADLVRNHSSVQLMDIVPSQDGFMPLQSQLVGVDMAAVFQRFNRIVKKEFDIDMHWSLKEFDEAILIPSCDIMPIDISIKDLELGETKISELIAPALDSRMKYSNKSEMWFYLNERNLWVASKRANEYLVSKTIQEYIEVEKSRVWTAYKACDDVDKKKKLQKDETTLVKYYDKVGKSSYIGQVCKYLRTILLNDKFEAKLDRTGGKIVFADGILDLKNGVFQRAFRSEDYITTHLSHNYVKECDPEKMAFLKSKLKEILNNNDEQLEYYLRVLGHSFTGDAHLEKSIYYIMDGTAHGRGDNGKTFFFNILETLLPEYVKHADPKLLEDANTKAHKQLAELGGARLVYLDEGTKKKLNHSLVKKIAEGLTMENEVMYGTTTTLNIDYKIFICSNHLPTIDKDEEAVYNRFKQIQFCSHFDRKGKRTVANPAKLEYIADTGLGDTLKTEYVNEILKIVCDYAMEYYKTGIPAIPAAFQAAADVTKIENNEFAKWFHKFFEVDSRARVSLDFIMEKQVAGLSRSELRKELSKLDFVFDKTLKGFEFKTKIDKDGREVFIQGGYEGFKVRVVAEGEEED